MVQSSSPKIESRMDELFAFAFAFTGAGAGAGAAVANCVVAGDTAVGCAGTGAGGGVGVVVLLSESVAKMSSTIC